jgi:hypothetical protein
MQAVHFCSSVIAAAECGKALDAGVGELAAGVEGAASGDHSGRCAGLCAGWSSICDLH